MAEVITLGGRRFEIIDFDRRTVAQDHYLMTLMRQSGVEKVMPTEEETDTAWSTRLRTALIDSGKAIDFIAGCLLPDCMDSHLWTVAVARETALHISGCDTDEDRAEALRLATEVVLNFFLHAARQSRNFRDSLAARAKSGQSGASAH